MRMNKTWLETRETYTLLAWYATLTLLEVVSNLVTSHGGNN